MVVTALAAFSNPDDNSHRQIVFGAPWEPLGFNPIRALDSGSYAAQTLVYEGLVKYDSHMEIVPAIAQRFSVASDGLTYSFSLRDQARFSDGSKVTVDDVVASISLAQSKLSPYKADFACITNIEKTGLRRFVSPFGQTKCAIFSEVSRFTHSACADYFQGRLKQQRIEQPSDRQRPLSPGPLGIRLRAGF